MEKSSATLKLHLDYLEEKYANNIIARFIDDLRIRESEISNSQVQSSIIDVEFGYRVLLSFFSEELLQVLDKSDVFNEYSEIYSACLRANDFNEIDSALITVPTKELTSIDINIYDKFLTNEEDFKNGTLEKEIGQGIFTMINESGRDNHLIVKQGRDVSKEVLKVTWFNGENIVRDLNINIEKGGPISLLPDWDTMLCSKIKNLGGHLGIGYQYIFLIVNFPEDMEEKLLKSGQLKALYQTLSEHTLNIINTFSLLNSLLLSFDIKNLLNTVATAKLTSLMAINFRHTLRNHIISSAYRSLSVVKEIFPDWTNEYDKEEHPHLNEDIIDIRKINKQRVNRRTIQDLLMIYNAVVGELEDNKLTQKFFSLESLKNSDTVFVQPFNLYSLLLKFKNSFIDVYADNQIDVIILDILKVKAIKITSPIIPGIMFNLFENAVKYCKESGKVTIAARIDRKTKNITIEFENDLEKAQFQKLNRPSLSYLIKPFERIDGQRHGMGLYYSYILLKEYFKSSGLKLSVKQNVKKKTYKFQASIHLIQE